MRILYIGRHRQANSNDDEGAVAHALRVLGHEVICIPEPHLVPASRRQPRVVLQNPITPDVCRTKADLLLWHHWGEFDQLQRFKMPRVFWLFDCVNVPDETLAGRNAARQAWLKRAAEVADVGFLTDGDAVAADTSGKLVWLPQGADERLAGATPAATQDIDILFTGISRGGGVQRESFVAEMQAKYGDRFHHVSRGVHGTELRELVGRAKVVVAPDSPVTDRYASNRVWLTLGFGGFLLHPWSKGLAGWLTPGRHLVYYHDRDDLHEEIEGYLQSPADRHRVAAAGLARTLREHLYRHRAAEMIRVLGERGLVP